MPPRRIVRRVPMNNTLFGTPRRNNFSSFMFGRKSAPPSAIESISQLIADTQKTLNTVQQAAPLLDQVKQLSPILMNLPTLLKMMSVLNEKSVNTDDTRQDGESIFQEEIKVDKHEEEKITQEKQKIFIEKEVARILRELGLD